MTEDQKPADRSELNDVIDEMDRFTKKVGEGLSGLFGGKKTHQDDSAAAESQPTTETQPPTGETPAG